ncbi:hypothetical protein [Roseovarius sp.]
MMREGMKFEEAIKYAEFLRENGYVGISIFHKHDFDALEANEGCYTLHAYTKAELKEMRADSKLDEDPLDAFEITNWTTAEDGQQSGTQMFGAETLQDLLQQVQLYLEQNETGT